MSPSPDRARLQATRERIAEELSGPLSSLGLDVEAVELTPAGNRRVLRVAVDQDGGMRDSDLVEASRLASEVLDGSDVMGKAPYTLEVTSPGVDRPLTLPRHWRRNADRLVRVTLAEGDAVTGRIGASTDRAVTLDVEGEARELAYADIAPDIPAGEFGRRHGCRRRHWRRRRENIGRKSRAGQCGGAGNEEGLKAAPENAHGELPVLCRARTRPTQMTTGRQCEKVVKG